MTFTEQIPTQRKIQAPNEVIETRLKSKKEKSIIFDNMGLREAKTSQQIRKTKLQSVPGGKNMIIMKGRSNGKFLIDALGYRPVRW